MQCTLLKIGIILISLNHKINFLFHVFYFLQNEIYHESFIKNRYFLIRISQINTYEIPRDQFTGYRRIFKRSILI